MLASISKKIDKYSLYIIVVLILTVFSYIGYFVYHNYFTAKANTNELFGLYREVPSEYIDMSRFNKTISSISEKTKTGTFSASSSDIFSY